MTEKLDKHHKNVMCI